MVISTRLGRVAGTPVRPRGRTLRATALLVLWAVMSGAGVLLAWSNRGLRAVGPDGQLNSTVDVSFVLVVAIFSCVYAIVGGLVTLRTGHVVGWLLLTIAVAFPSGVLMEQYVLHGVVTAPGSLSATTVVAWLSHWVFGLAATSLTLILLLFPTGTVRSRRWRPLLVATPVTALLWAVPFTLRPGPLNGPWNDHGVHIVNPLGVRAIESPLYVVFGVGIAASLLISVAGVVCLVLRFRGSRGVERQQMKWLAFVGVAAGTLFVTNLVLIPTRSELSDYVFEAFFIVLMLGIPLSIGAAILRYRLYDIDRLISRTVTYATLIALLVGLYVGLVIGLGRLIEPLTRGSDLVVAMSTLIVAALFRPVLRRVQGVIERRFNRSRYDAARTIEAFTAHLRDEVDIDALGAELQAVVGKTMQPAHVSIWLR
jgi:hypothetical protein